MSGEAAPEYANQIEFVKEAIGEGKVVLRIHNVSISNDGPYQCWFDGSGFTDVILMNLNVTGKLFVEHRITSAFVPNKQKYIQIMLWCLVFFFHTLSF